MAFKFKIQRRPVEIGLPGYPRQTVEEDPEVLTGTVKGFQASAPEERFAKALDKAHISYQFRLTVGAPRGLPGWKELDFVVQSGGLLYAIEVDTAFTHRQKENSDVLHDAIILNDQELQSMGTFYPKVIHADGDNDLADNANARQFVARMFGRGGSSFVAQPGVNYNIPALEPIAATPYIAPQPATPAPEVYVPPPVENEDDLRRQQNARVLAQRAARLPITRKR
jgi:hypothetical protein